MKIDSQKAYNMPKEQSVEKWNAGKAQWVKKCLTGDDNKQFF